MCGICGIVDLAEQPLAETVAHMTLALKHRGPDAGAFTRMKPAFWGIGACPSWTLPNPRTSRCSLRTA